MSGPAVAAALLALVMLVLPGPPRRRLGRPGRATSKDRPVPPIWLGAGLPVVAVLALLGPAVTIAAALLTAALWHRSRAARARRRSAAEGHTLAEALDVMAGELRIGAHPVRALTTAAEEVRGADAVPTALHAVSARARLGADVATALEHAARGMALPGHWHRLGAMWRLANTHGLAVAELIRAAHRDVLERRRYADAVDAQLAGARATTAILAGLPVVGIVLGHGMGARPLQFLTGSAPGGGCLILGVGFLAAGLLWAGRLTDRLTA